MLLSASGTPHMLCSGRAIDVSGTCTQTILQSCQDLMAVNGVSPSPHELAL